jgi:hypothetical protein
MKFIYCAVSVIASTSFTQAAWSADSLAQRIEACAQHQDDAARLKCFDAEAHALRAAATAEADHAPSTAAARAGHASSSATSTRTPAAAAARSADARAAGNVGEENLAEPSRPSRPAGPRDNPASGQPVSARVVSISRTPTLQRRIELDNGQIWQENEHDKSILLAAGDNVDIQLGALRSFVLRVPSGATTHVRRVR